MIGVDTLQVNLSEWGVLPGHSLTVKPSPYSPTTGEVFGDYKLWQGQHGIGAHYNDARGRFFLDVRPRGGRVGCSVHLSIPKYATGGRDNLQLVGGDVAGEVLKDLNKELAGVGIATNVDEAQLSRVDVTRNIQADEPFTVYRPVLSLVEGKRLKDRREYVDGFLWGNSAQQVVAYDKVQQLRSMKVDPGAVRDVLRFEYRMRDARKCRDVFGFGNVKSLVSEYGSVGDVYRLKMKEHVFRFSPDSLEVLSSRVIEEELLQFSEVAGRNWLAKWVEAYGVRQIVKLAEVDTVAKVVANVTGDRKKAYRIATKLRQALVNTKLLEHDTATQKTYRTLYGELRMKVLRAA